MLYDRDPRWTLFSDKWRVRRYVAEKAGPACLVPLLWQGTRPEDIPFSDLPSRFVIKATHGCGYNILVEDKDRIDRPGVVRQLSEWLEVNYATDVFPCVQWGYKHIEPSIIVEEYLGAPGHVPWDYKIYCFAGRVHFVEVHLDRFGSHSTVTMDRDFELVDIKFSTLPGGSEPVRPENRQELIRVAEALSEGLDFMRVDLYGVGGRVYFGELTCYHGGGIVSTRRREDDFRIGQLWRMPDERGRPCR